MSGGGRPIAREWKRRIDEDFGSVRQVIMQPGEKEKLVVVS